MSRRPLWQEVHERFDPEESVLVDRTAWRAERPHSPVADILKRLATPFTVPRILLLGTVGTGKTTELVRVAEARAGDDFVVFLDLAHHFDKVVGNSEALQRLSSWEICFLAGLSLYRAAQDRIDFDWPPEVVQALGEAWTAAVSKATGTPTPPGQLDLGKLAKSMVVLGSSLLPGGGAIAAGLQLLGSASEAVRWNLPMGQARNALPDDAEEMKNMLASVNRLVREIELRHRRVLFVIDGLDRIRDVDRAQALFVESEMLARLACPVVVCGPFALRHRPVVSEVRRFQVRYLVNEPVLKQESPEEFGEGVSFFWDLFRLRVAGLGADDLISHELLLKLAYRSGGRARDFVRLIRELALRAWQDDVVSATEELVDAVIDDARLLLETGMHRGHIEVLESVMVDPDHQLPQDELVWEPLTSSRLLPYPNESEWFYPHPLLTMHLLHPRPAGSTR